jgi:type VI secretion system secreted protein VgrG
MQSKDLGSLLADFANAFQQHNRLLTLHFAGSGPAADTLLPFKLSGAEQLSHCYRYQLDCLAIDAALELKTLLGLPALIEILTAHGARRPISGIVTSVQTLPSDGGFAAYRLIIEPGLALLGLRRTSRVFQAKTVPQIVQAILAEHQAANPILAQSFTLELHLEKPHPPRSYCVQHRETDLAFIERLLAEEGISYRFAFASDPALPSHTLVLFDDGYQLQAGAQRKLRFHRADGTETEDTLFGWTSARQLVPGQASLHSYDYKPAASVSITEDSFLEHGPAAGQAMRSLEDYQPQTHYYAADFDGHSRYGKLRQQANDLLAKSFSGESNVRELSAGEWFQLDHHPAHDNDQPEQRQFVVLGLELTAVNNLPHKLQQAVPPGLQDTADPAKLPYRNSFIAVRRGINLVPGFDSLTPSSQDTLLSGLTARHAKPSAPGPQTAIVVGPPGEVVYTDSLGRVCVQFHWQRPNEHPDGSANFNDKSSTWIRVAYPSAGAGFGHQFIPRVGEEVIVNFLDGDIDRPVIVGVLYNGSHAVPSFSGAPSLPANKTLSGIKSEEHGGGQYGELLFDDTPGQVRTKLSSEHGKTQLNLGYLTHPRSEGQAEPRGDGFELRTDRHGAIRAGHGLLLSAEARHGASGQQLDRAQALSQLATAQSLAEALGETATHQLADTHETGPLTIGLDNAPQAKASQGHHDHLTNAVKSWANGTNTKDSHGNAAGRQPILLATAPAGIALTTPDALLLTSGANLDTVSQRDTQQTTARRWIHNVGQKISLFVQGAADKVNLKLITAKGHAQLHAQDGDVEIAGDKSLRLYACKEKLTAAAGKELLLTCGGAYIRLAGGNIEIHAPGGISYKGAKHDFSGPARGNHPLPFLPKDPEGNGYSIQFEIDPSIIDSIVGDKDTAEYKLFDMEQNLLHTGSINSNGKTDRYFHNKYEKVRAIIGKENNWKINNIE